MKFKKYFDYLLFIARNWNLRLAVFTTYHEVRGERKYHINTTTINDLKDLHITSGNKRNAYIYQPVNYYMIEAAFDFLKEQGIEGALVDFGCGKGRVLAIAAHYGYKAITGIEFASELCNEARNNIQNMRENYPQAHFSLICNNAVHYKILPADQVLVFFNPFDETVMIPVVKNILASARETPRDITVVYFNPTAKEIFLSAGFTEAWYFKKMEYLDFSILQLTL